MSRMENFILDRGSEEAYAEKRCDLHDNLTYEMAEIVAKLLPEKGKVLDVGCGQGPALEWFTKNGFDTLGITTCVADLIACENHGWPVVLEDQNNMPPMWTENFDCVWARHVLEHSIAPLWTLHEFARVLKPQGILYLETPGPNTSANHEQNKNHYSVFDWRMLSDLLDRSGFEVLDARQMQLHIPNLGADLYLSFTCKKR